MIEMTGRKFGRLTVIEFYGFDKYHSATWKCQCECGNTVIVDGRSLRRGATRSCGCYDKEMHIIHPNRRTHGMRETRLYSIWKGMRGRCGNKNDKSYGGRGISVCKEWDDFMSFYKWSIENGYADDLTIDRKDVDGDYCPANCRWVTPKEQQNNKRTNHFLTINGETHTLKEWASISGVLPSTLYQRIKRGATGEDIIKRR